MAIGLFFQVPSDGTKRNWPKFCQGRFILVYTVFKKKHHEYKDDQWLEQQSIWVTILGDIKKLCACGTKGYAFVLGLAVLGQWLYFMT